MGAWAVGSIRASQRRQRHKVTIGPAVRTIYQRKHPLCCGGEGDAAGCCRHEPRGIYRQPGPIHLLDNAGMHYRVTVNLEFAHRLSELLYLVVDEPIPASYRRTGPDGQRIAPPRWCGKLKLRLRCPSNSCKAVTINMVRAGSCPSTAAHHGLMQFLRLSGNRAARRRQRCAREGSEDRRVCQPFLLFRARGPSSGRPLRNPDSMD